MAIYKPNQLDFSSKKVKMIIYGVPSIGKTTLALSAPKPLLIDLDRGISRVEARYRQDTLIANTFDELMSDLKGSDLSNYETLVVDTGGGLLEQLKPYVMKKDAKNATRSGDLALAGWGAIAREFKEFGEFANQLGKHIIYVFHASEDKDGDITKYRLSADGSTKTKIWEGIDLGGFLEMSGKDRTINFSANDRSFAKGNHEINGSYKVPTLKDGVDNTFLTDLINTYLTKLNETTAVLSAETESYNRAMQFKLVIDGANNEVAVNNAYSGLKSLNHALTSKVELWNELNNKASELGLEFDKATDTFIKENLAQ